MHNNDQGFQKPQNQQKNNGEYLACGSFIQIFEKPKLIFLKPGSTFV